MEHPLSSAGAFPVQAQIEVQWGEMDAAGHVNNVVYLKWFEHARVAYLSHLSYPIVLEGTGLPGVILAKQDCKYLFPVIYPDTIDLGIQVTELSEDRFAMHCRMFSQRHQRLVAIANAVMVTYDYRQGSKAPVPGLLREGIQRLEGWAKR
ncbi:acyl-CoA thioesterase [Phaeodactylibacter luteus]|uniref:Acyl-CoA thioesterase n=1 Tax=Phaeodactylibacter luteus TaxID=1564516 RepID=A0A5C6RJS2_9BACT|nr:thioesterase family protein [Phaeodactylibacter luteus]TXB62666.1 acyl-CoA thioesterase [Phaeodactylibacter luteus]